MCDDRSGHELVREFHEKAQHPVRLVPRTGVSADERLDRASLVLEEAIEFVEACGYRVCIDTGSGRPRVVPSGRLYDPVHAAHELGDLSYVTEGSALVLGFPLRKIMQAIHNANMTRFLPNGKMQRHPMRNPHPDSRYQPPDIAGILLDAGWEP